MAASGINFAVLHDEAGVAASSTVSDVDLVTTMAPVEILLAMDRCLRNNGIHPIVSWQYDVDSSSLFFTDGVAAEGAQLDLVHGNTGLGNYGLQAAPILDKSERGDRWMRASDLHELLYSIRKGQRKGRRLDDLLAIASKVPPGEIAKGCQEVFSREAAAAVLAVIRSRRSRGLGFGESYRRAWHNATRLARRTRHPTGFWIALQGENSGTMASEISQRFNRLLPKSGHGAIDGNIRSSVVLLGRMASVRWRAGVFVSYGLIPPLPKPDLTLQTDGTHLEEAMRTIVNAMQRRLAT